MKFCLQIFIRNITEENKSYECKFLEWLQGVDFIRKRRLELSIFTRKFIFYQIESTYINI